ncbi:hypothetical protein FGF1_31380 [Flavobacteriaceae bacterium GF1]
MKVNVQFIPLSRKNIDTYITVGIQSYNAHYLHLWENNNTIPYISTSFTAEVVTSELANPNCDNYVIVVDHIPAGVLKITRHKACANFTGKEALYLHRLYLKKDFTGKGIGNEVLLFCTDHARKLQKKVIWLEAMKKGNALAFYQKNGFGIIGETKIALPGVKSDQKEMWVLAKSI